MNNVLQYLVAVVGTAIAHLIFTWVSNAFIGLGTMFVFGVQKSASPKFARDIMSDDPSTPAARGVMRAQLLGALPGCLGGVVCALLSAAGLGYLAPDAAWIPGLWFIIIVFGSFSIARAALWFLLKSFFVSPERLAADIANWQSKLEKT